MKTTLDLDDEVLKLSKKRAAAQGVSLRAYVEDTLRARLLPRADRQRPFKLKLPTIKGESPPAVDIADRDALYDLIERE